MTRQVRRKRFFLILLVLFLLPILLLSFWYERQVRQQRLDHALIEAIKKNDTVAVIALLDQGVDANTTEKPYTPITLKSLLGEFWNSIKGNKPPRDTTQFTSAILLECKYAPAFDESFSIPENPRVTAALLEHGADPYKTDAFGDTALHGAASMGYTATVKILLEHHVDPNSKGSQGKTPLMNADEKCAMLLLENGAEVNARDKDGWTPLMCNSDPGAWQLLTDHHADVNAQSYDGRTALMIATLDYSDTTRVLFLLHHGARASIKDKEGLTALDLAKNNGEKNKIPLLEEAFRKENAKKNPLLKQVQVQSISQQ